MLSRWDPDWDKRPASDSLQVSIEQWVATKARGQGPDPLDGTRLDAARVGQVAPVEVLGAGPGLAPDLAVARLQTEVAAEAGRLAPETGPGLHLDLSAQGWE